MQTEIILNDRQKANLKIVIKHGKLDYNSEELDRRSIRAPARNLVKVVETKKGTFVQPTAKGKKLN